MAESSSLAPLDAERTKVVWLIRLRWVAIAGQLAVLAPALSQGWLEPGQVSLFGGTVAALGLFNVLAWWRLPRRQPPKVGVLGHVAVDLAALTVLLVLSGGAWNPFAPLFFIHAGLGALLLTGWRTYALAVLLCAVATTINLGPSMPPAMPEAPTPVGVQLPTQILIALVVWAMTSWLAAGLAQQRRLMQNLRDHQGRVDRLRATGALAAGFSHQFSTPLNTLKMRLDRIGRRDLGPDAMADVDAANDAASSCEAVLKGMIGRQLDPAKLRLEHVDLGRLVRRVADSWVSAGNRTVSVVGSTERLCHLPPLVLTQVLLDLLDNAAEASDGLIELTVGCDDESCRVAISDRGAGWPDVVRANLGQPFLTTKATGTGLGLYNAHSLAVALGGTLLLEDRPGGGAVAAFRIPCHQEIAPEGS